MIQFREVIDGDRYPGYSSFGDKAADKLRADKSFTYEFDINVYDYDAVNGFPAFNGYTNAVNYANGYDFLNGRFYVADYDAMGTGNSMDNGCIGTVYAEATDMAGNKVTKTLTISNIDKILPTVTVCL